MRDGHCAAIILVIGVAAYFWISWWQSWQVYIAETTAIQTTLEQQGLMSVRVFPKSEGCYTFNAMKTEYQVVTGKICIGEDDE